VFFRAFMIFLQIHFSVFILFFKKQFFSEFHNSFELFINYNRYNVLKVVEMLKTIRFGLSLFLPRFCFGNATEGQFPYMLIRNLLMYFTRERDNNGQLLPVAAVQERVV
jgi:hypothetical protein